MFSLLTPLAAALLTFAPADSARAHDEASWRPIVALDEVTVDLDASSVTGAGPFTVLLRWSFADRAVSPRAWDEGVRYSLDVVQVDCRAASTRTLRSVAYAADGGEVGSMSYVQTDAAWTRPRGESVGGMVTEGVCAALRAR